MSTAESTLGRKQDTDGARGRENSDSSNSAGAPTLNGAKPQARPASAARSASSSSEAASWSPAATKRRGKPSRAHRRAKAEAAQARRGARDQVGRRGGAGAAAARRRRRRRAGRRAPASPPAARRWMDYSDDGRPSPEATTERPPANEQRSPPSRIDENSAEGSDSPAAAAPRRRRRVVVSADETGATSAPTASPRRVRLTPAPPRRRVLPAPFARHGDGRRGAARRSCPARRRRQGGEADRGPRRGPRLPRSSLNPIVVRPRRHRLEPSRGRNLDATVVAFNSMNVPLSPVTGGRSPSPRPRRGRRRRRGGGGGGKEAAAEERLGLGAVIGRTASGEFAPGAGGDVGMEVEIDGRSWGA